MILTSVKEVTPVASVHCKGGLRTIQLYSKLTNAPVRVEGRHIIASKIDSQYREHALQIPLQDKHFALYDLKAKMFICWRNDFSNLIPRRNPRNFKHCRFTEEVSITHPSSHSRFTTIHKKRGQKKEEELKFNRSGNYSTKTVIRKCLERKKKITFNIQLMLDIDTLTLKKKSPEEEAYKQLSKDCANPNLLVKHFEDCGWTPFCEQMERIHKKNPIACELSEVCRIKNKRCEK